MYKLKKAISGLMLRGRKVGHFEKAPTTFSKMLIKKWTQESQIKVSETTTLNIVRPLQF